MALSFWRNSIIALAVVVALLTLFRGHGNEGHTPKSALLRATETLSEQTKFTRPAKGASRKESVEHAPKHRHDHKHEQVWCGQPEGCAEKQPFGACWLKYAPHPRAPDQRKSPEVTFTAGALYEDPPEGPQGPERNFHVAVTATDSVYQQWQMRIMYYWYKKMKASDPHTQMGGFTRILHSGKPDAYMDEIPSYVVNRLEGIVATIVLLNFCKYLLTLIAQWLEKADIPEKYILMSEPDHLFLRPLPNLMIGEKPAAFPFFYIKPSEFPALVRKYVGNISDKELRAMDPVGSSPDLLSKEASYQCYDLKRLAPRWMNLTITMKVDPEADKAWGWVLEMWAYTCAAQLENIHHDLHPLLAAQPPWDRESGDFYILHYTYGCDYDLQGSFTPGKIGQWRFDKRAFSSSWPPKNYTKPPKGVPELTVRLIDMINEATANLPNWGSS
eukprot:jgi/Chlat1/6031/Chrsp4S00489